MRAVRIYYAGSSHLFIGSFVALHIFYFLLHFLFFFRKYAYKKIFFLVYFATIRQYFLCSPPALVQRVQGGPPFHPRPFAVLFYAHRPHQSSVFRAVPPSTPALSLSFLAPCQIMSDPVSSAV